ncbi:MAG: hypothetical protein HXY40_13450 [Chloroflexi bacterium]|nr:hypothetical protein [Chloroflexota bacterium]
MNTKILLFPLFALWLAACVPAPQVADLPTLAEIPSMTATDTATITPPAAATASASPTLPASAAPTLSVTWTPSATITDTPTNTATATATLTAIPRPINDLVSEAMRATVVTPDPTLVFQQATALALTLIASGNTPVAGGTPGSVPSAPGGTPAAGCGFAPMGGFAVIYNGSTLLQQQLGCPTNSAITYSSALQNFERGLMLWLQGPPASIYLLYPDLRYRRFDDSYVEGVDPLSGGEIPPFGLIEPVRGFGKIWRMYQDVRSDFGWAISGEIGAQSSAQSFSRGWMVALPQRSEVFIFIDDGSGIVGVWQTVPGGF